MEKDPPRSGASLPKITTLPFRLHGMAYISEDTKKSFEEHDLSAEKSPN